MRVGIVALLQESNTFLPEKTRLEHFERDVLLTGEAVRKHFADAPHEVGGFFAGLAAEGIDAVPLFAARAMPFGVIAADAWDELTRRLVAALDAAGPLDGLLVAPHGATVSESEPDADGHWLTLVRQRLGPDFPIVGTLDLHANLSPRMAIACNALVAYRTNPHLDQRDRGIDAARLLARTLRGEVRPTTAANFPPVVVNIECHGTEESPARELFARAEEIRGRPGVLSASVLLGFPYADVAEMGTSFLIVTNNDLSFAQQLADELGGWLWEQRESFRGTLWDVETALDQATQLDSPVCLLDMGDNVGGGSPGDSTWLVHALLRRGLGPSVVCLDDAESAAAAARAGVGGKVSLRMGGKSGPMHGSPVEAEVVVVGVSDGRFRESQTRHGGFTTFDQGRTAAVRVIDGPLTIVLTSRRTAPFSLGQLTCCGLEPAAFRFLVAKGVHAPVAAYRPVCRHLVRVDSPGVTTADPRRLTFRHRRQPLFPFEGPS